ncbi:MAG: hypothetical protein WA830_07665 [Candidatus Sulfotelmatobacter sp.]
MIIAQSVLSSHVAVPGAWRADWTWGLPLIIVTVVSHVLSLGMANESAVRFYSRMASGRHPMAVFVVVISGVTLVATFMHAAETSLWAVFYLILGARPDYKSAMLYSLGAVTTYGHSGLYLEQGWQLMGAIEALSGWLLFGLTGAFLFSLIQRCRQISGRDLSADPTRGPMSNSSHGGKSSSKA